MLEIVVLLLPNKWFECVFDVTRFRREFVYSVVLLLIGNAPIDMKLANIRWKPVNQNNRLSEPHMWVGKKTHESRLTANGYPKYTLRLNMPTNQKRLRQRCLQSTSDLITVKREFVLKEMTISIEVYLASCLPWYISLQDFPHQTDFQWSEQINQFLLFQLFDLSRSRMATKSLKPFVMQFSSMISNVHIINATQNWPMQRRCHVHLRSSECSADWIASSSTQRRRNNGNDLKWI